MQTIKTKMKRTKSKRTAKPAGQARPSTAKPQYIGVGSRTTHVILPIDEYERLMLADMAADAHRVAADPQSKWVDVDDFFAQVTAKRLVAARKAQGVTQQELANRLGVAQTQISRIEKNPDRTTLRTLKRIAKALKVDVKNLID